MDATEKTVKKNYVYQGKILKVRCDDALLPDGRACKREIVEHRGGAAVLCVHRGKIAFVKQYRYAYGEEVLEIPAGKLEANEDPASAAKRELREETGACAETLEEIAVVYPSPGYTDEKIYVYRAHGVSLSSARLDDDEFLSVKWIGEEKTKQMLFAGKFNDSKTLIALQDYFLKSSAK
ncbi:MAG: NUDIX hydrolase [Candidatus Scatosoma sp.]